MVSWNCQGIGSTLTVRRLREILRSILPDVMFLMETKNQEKSVLYEFHNTDFTNHFLVPPLGVSGGLALFWKDNVEIEVLDSSPNYIDAKIKYKATTALVTFTYGPPLPENRAPFWNLLELRFASREDAWLLTGDFNELLSNEEKRGGPERPESSFLGFRSLVSQLGLLNVKHSGNSLSWRGSRHSHFVKARLDRTLANFSWFEKYPAGRTKYLRFEGSDHRPLVSYFGKENHKKNGLFRLDRTIYSKEEVRKLVKTSWKNHLLESVLC